CLENLFATVSEETPCEIIVTNDGSTDDTVDVLRPYENRIRIVSHDVNKGFSISCNDGAATANGEYLVFLNNDTIPQKGWLDALILYADMHPEAAIVGSKLLFPNDTIQHAGIALCEDGEARHFYAGLPADHPSVNRSRRLSAVTGACLLIRSRDFRMVQGFDSSFRNGYEDVDLCLRLGELGREVHYCHESVLYHLEAATREPAGENEIHNRKLYRSRWGDRVVADELHHYVMDDLLKIEHTSIYPIKFSISPLLGTFGGLGEDQADRLIQARSRQVLGLLKDNIRLNVRVQAAELRKPVAYGAHKTGLQKTSSVPVEARQVVHRGRIMSLSTNRSSRIVSVIPPVKNAAPKLRQLLTTIMAQQTRDCIEIVAVDSASTDDTVELLKGADATVIAIDPRS